MVLSLLTVYPRFVHNCPQPWQNLHTFFLVYTSWFGLWQHCTLVMICNNCITRNYMQDRIKNALFMTCCNTLALDCLWGVVLTKKNLHIPGSLSLSLLHWKREWEERSGGVGPQLDPTTQLPFLANVLLTSWHTDRCRHFPVVTGRHYSTKTLPGQWPTSLCARDQSVIYSVGYNIVPSVVPVLI